MKRLSKQNINTPDFYNSVFSSQPYRDEVPRVEAMLKPIKDGTSVVELGCGISTFLFRVDATFPNCEVHGLDFSTVALERAGGLAPNVHFQPGDFLNTPYETDYFDFVCGGEILEHVEDPKMLVKEMVRICRPGGMLILSTPLKELESRGFFTPEHLWEFNERDMFDLFSPFGQVTIQVLRSKWDYLIVYLKVKK